MRRSSESPCRSRTTSAPPPTPTPHGRRWPDVERAAAAEGFRTRWGRMVLEILPPVEATKGTAVRHLLAAHGLERALYAGDDTTDLDGFAALDGLEVAIRVAVASSEGPAELTRARRHRASVNRRRSRLPARAVAQTPSRSRSSRTWRRATGSSVLPAVRELQAHVIRPRPPNGDDLGEVHEMRAVDTGEAARRKLPLEVGERRSAEVRAVVGVDAAVVAVGLHEMDLVVLEELAASSGDDRHPLDGSRIVGGALAEPFDEPREPLGVDGLEQVVERLDREGLEGVALVRGDEHHGRRIVHLAHERRGLDPGQSRHLDVEEDDVRARRARQGDRLGRTGRLPDDLDLRVAREQIAELRARGRLVVDEQGANRHSSPSETGTSSRATVPNGNERSFTPSP